MTDPERRHTQEEAPPFLGSWRNVYTAVIIYLAFVIASMYVFTITFTR